MKYCWVKKSVRFKFPGLGAIVLVLLCRSATLAQEGHLILARWENPTYPPLARAARVQGEVVIHYRVDESGGATDVQVVSGHPLLAPRAEEAVRTWRFTPPVAGFETGKVHQTVFRFTMTERPEGISAFQWHESYATYDGVDSVEVSASWSDVQVEGDCAAAGRAHQPLPDRTVFGPGDFIELARSGCYGTCPSYRVRLFRTGQLEWEGGSFVTTGGIARAIVDADETAELLEEASTLSIWSLCNSYSRSVTDDASVGFKANLGGETKTIDDYANSGPTVLHALIRRIDRVADTHRWRHGDPSSEPLSNINSEVWYGKPSMTPLMEAVTMDESRPRLAELLGGEAVVDETDESGWTALMYAAANNYGASVPRLLDAGANPNHRDLQGHTPLMAAATGGWFDENLLQHGADLDAQSKAGLTALMILASQGDAEELDLALVAGADPLLQDLEGRTALDYLLESNCRRDPLRNPLNEMWIITTDKCDGLDEDDFNASRKRLRKAVSAAKRTNSRRR